MSDKIEQNIENIIKNTIKSNNLISKNDKILVGLSGGLDSVCLFHILRKYEVDLHCVHINHGIRGDEAERDFLFCEELCTKYNVTFKIIHEDVQSYAKKNKLSVEEAGRIVRYNAFNEESEANNCTKIALAHHKNDQAETILMNVIRGTGLLGLKGMSYARGKIIRPLLDVTKKELEDYSIKQKYLHCVDSTNSENNYTRNRLRNELIPQIERGFNENIVEQITNMARLVKDDEAFISSHAENIYSENIIYKDESKITINYENIKNNHIAIKKRVVRLAYNDICGSLKDFTLKQVNSIIKIMENTSGKEISLGNNIVGINDFGKLTLFAKNNENIPKDEDIIVKLDEIIYCEKFNLYIEASCEEKNYKNLKKICTIAFSCDRIIGDVNSGKLKLRSRESSDRIYFKAINGHKKVKSLFSEKKIHRYDRDLVPILAVDNEVVCIFLDKPIISDYYKLDNNKIQINFWRETNERNN